jgi:Flp pilus assembly protein TadG
MRISEPLRATKDVEHKRRKLGLMKGQTIMEFPVIVPLFFLLLFGVIDFGRLFFVQMSLQNAIRQAGRFAVTGNHLPDPKKPGQNLSRVDSIIKTAQQAAMGLDVTNVQVTSSKGGTGNAGGPGDTVTISLTTNMKLITPIISRFFGPKGTYKFTVSVSFKNEPFPPGNTV